MLLLESLDIDYMKFKQSGDYLRAIYFFIPLQLLPVFGDIFHKNLLCLNDDGALLQDYME